MDSDSRTLTLDLQPRRNDLQAQILNAIPSILVLIDEANRVLEWNYAAQNILGICVNQALGQSITELAINWSRDDLLRGIGAAWQQQKPQRLDPIDYELPNGSKGILGFTLVPLRSEQGRNLGCIIQGAEITEKRRLERELTQAQKMESVGQLAAGIAHEINTPTQYIGDNLRFLEEAFEQLSQLPRAYQELLVGLAGQKNRSELDGRLDKLKVELDLDYLSEEIPQALQQALHGIAEVSRIVTAMKEFSHPNTKTKEPSDINAALTNTITITRNEWKYVANVDLDLDATLPLVPCFMGELNQVFLNIVVNAAHAIEEKLEEKRAMTSMDAPEIGIEKGLIKITTRLVDNIAEICIGDNGKGIPDEAQPRIFDLFFTTKEVGKGTGQGLALSYSIVSEKHGGSISFETEQGVGTTFIIRLPLIGAVTNGEPQVLTELQHNSA